MRILWRARCDRILWRRRFSGCGPCAAPACADGAAETAQLDLLALLERDDDAAEDGVDDDLRVLLREVRHAREWRLQLSDSLVQAAQLQGRTGKWKEALEQLDEARALGNRDTVSLQLQRAKALIHWTVDRQPNATTP